MKENATETYRKFAIGLVGPLPPPPGGMANQLRQLARLLETDGQIVHVVRVNRPFKPAWIGKLRGVRALFRLVPYLMDLWRTAGRVDVMHVLANSGWSWHLFAAPAVWVARARSVPVIINYRGGGAQRFFEQSWWAVRPTMRRVDLVVVPSGFLRDVFMMFDTKAEVVPNIVNLSSFRSADKASLSEKVYEPRLLVTRNLEAIYDNATAIRALALVRDECPGATLTIAGDGPARAELQCLVSELGLDEAVKFTGRLDNQLLPSLYREADIMLNPSLTDNTPNSILESFATGVPVVSTRVGGIPYMVEDGKTALLVEPGSPEDMSRAILRLCSEPELFSSLRQNALKHVKQFEWDQVRPILYATYGRLCGRVMTP